MDDSSRPGMFSEVSRPATLSEKVAERITEAIMDGTLPPGERLLSERELGEQFGVSRTVIREAVRSLVASGLVEARSGRGLQVAEVGPGVVSRAMSMFLRRSDGIDYRRVHEVRAALEIKMVGFAAERATPEDIQRLQELTATLIDELNGKPEVDVERAAELDVGFHRAIAQATHNELFVLLLDAIRQILLEIRRLAFESSDVRDYAIEAHQQILREIMAGDAAAACEAMRQHLETSVQIWAGDGLGTPA